MYVTLAPGIETASGTLCKSKNGKRVVFTTRKAATTSKNKVRMYIRDAESYQRTTELSEKEIRSRELFARRREYVKQLVNEKKCKTSAEAWKIAKAEIKD